MSEENDPSGTFNPNRKRVATGPTPQNQSENRTPVFPASQSDPNVFRQEDSTQKSRMLTLEAQGQSIVSRPGTSGIGGIKSQDRQTVTTPPPESQAFQGSQPEYIEGDPSLDAQDSGSGHSVTYQSQSWWKEPRVKTNPARNGETEK